MAIGKDDNLDVVIDRKRKKCGRCGQVMVVTTECPLRKGRENPYVCCYCCNYKCRYTKEEEIKMFINGEYRIVEKRKYCGVKRNIKLARQKEAEKARKKRNIAQRQEYRQAGMEE